MSAMSAAQKNAILASAQAGILDSNLLDAIVGTPVSVPTPVPAAPKAPKAVKVATPKPVKAAPKARQTRTSKPKAADWRNMAVSTTQIDRIRRCEAALNAHDGESYDLSVKADFANKGEASDHYTAIAAMGTAAGLNWAK